MAESSVAARRAEVRTGRRGRFDASVYIAAAGAAPTRDVAADAGRRRNAPRPRSTRYAGTRSRCPPARPRHVLPGVYPNWDNTPRSGSRGLVLTARRRRSSAPHVARGGGRAAGPPVTQRLLWIKSWNEWAEGNHLEPDLDFGHQYLEAVRDAVLRKPSG